MIMSNHLRNVVCFCPVCDREKDMICREREHVPCPWCGIEMEQRWWLRVSQKATVWDQHEWATVFKDRDGKFSFPARADKPTPEGYERITIKSDVEMARVEREANVRSERRWFNSGSGSGHDTQELPELPFRVAR